MNIYQFKNTHELIQGDEVEQREDGQWKIISSDSYALKDKEPILHESHTKMINLINHASEAQIKDAFLLIQLQEALRKVNLTNHADEFSDVKSEKEFISKVLEVREETPFILENN